MSSEFLKEREIKYTNKDFQSFKRDLIKFSQAHHSGSFQDFNESSPGMALLELTAYVGDVLSFYQDMQFEELRQENSRQIENVVSFAKLRGYKPAGKRAASGRQAFYLEVPATVENGRTVPNTLYMPVIRKGAKCEGPGGVVFETVEDLPMSASTTESPLLVTGSRFDDATGLPTHYAIRRMVDITAGETVEDSVTITEFQRFRTVELSNPDVIEIISVVDSDGNNWYEVDYLAQETVFTAVSNGSSDSEDVPYILKLQAVPRRFVVDRDPLTNKSTLIFGSGDGVNFDDELLPNLADLAIPLRGRTRFSSYVVDPQNFIKTRSLGLSPYNTTLTITYRVGGGAETNVSAGSIKTVKEAVLDFSTTNLNAATKGAVETSVECVNPDKTEGGGAAESISEIKANAAAFFAAQDRVVTKEDYIARIMTLPSKFGKPEKVFVKRDVANPLALDVHILTLNSSGNLTQATSTLAQNIRTYIDKYRMLTDAVNILQTNIINLKVEFGVVISPKFNRTEVLTKCLKVVKDYTQTSKMQIGQPIVVTDLLAELQSIYGVISVYKLDFKNLYGTQSDGSEYSDYRFDVPSSLLNNILYCPEDAIFEVKFPEKDIVGESK